MNLELLSDEELVARARAVAGPPGVEFIDELFRRHYARVARWCFRFTDDRESAADLAQEIFAKVYRSLDSFQAQSRFSTWLYSVAKNECLNAVKARPAWPGYGADEMRSGMADQDESDFGVAAERVSSAELARQLLNDALNETERTVFTLHFGEDLPLEAISRLLALKNASGAKAYLVSARRKLSRSIQRWKAREQRAMGQGREQ